MPQNLRDKIETFLRRKIKDTILYPQNKLTFQKQLAETLQVKELT